MLRSTCIRQRSVEAPTLWMKLVKYILWNVEEKWKARRAGLWFGEEGDSWLPDMQLLWAYSFWIMSENKAGLR